MRLQVLGNGGEDAMPSLRDMHRRILSNLDEMQERWDTVIKEHEHNLLRHFRSKLYEAGFPRSLACNPISCRLTMEVWQVEEAISKRDEEEDTEQGVPRTLITRVADTSRVMFPTKPSPGRERGRQAGREEGSAKSGQKNRVPGRQSWRPLHSEYTPSRPCAARRRRWTDSRSRRSGSAASTSRSAAPSPSSASRRGTPPALPSTVSRSFFASVLSHTKLGLLHSTKSFLSHLLLKRS